MPKRVNESLNKKILTYARVRPIAYIPLLGGISGSATAGLFLSQMVYWHGKGRNRDWFYKTIKEFEQETGLSRSEQERAIKIWEDKGVLEKRLRGVPPKRNFKINIETLIRLIDSATGK